MTNWERQKGEKAIQTETQNLEARLISLTRSVVKQSQKINDAMAKGNNDGSFVLMSQKMSDEAKQAKVIDRLDALEGLLSEVKATDDRMNVEQQIKAILNPPPPPAPIQEEEAHEHGSASRRKSTKKNIPLSLDETLKSPEKLMG